MRDTDLLQTALGLAAPWVVSGNRFDAAARRLDIDITFAKGARFACPGCGAAGCPVLCLATTPGSNPLAEPGPARAAAGGRTAEPGVTRS